MKILIIAFFMMSSAFAANPIVVMETSMGSVEIELNEEKAPISVKNFLEYVDSGFYSGTIFHRVINGFMIQGGGFLPNMSEKKNRAPIKNEAGNGLTNDAGTIAMARTSDLNSATSQFYINVNDNTSLNHRSESADGFGYAVFGKVTTGMHVVNRIKMVKTGMMNGMGDVPMDTVLIKSITRKGAAPVVEAPKAKIDAPIKKTSKKKKAKK
jgi:peptidyl-prolyl cis-trans isomerase B (cyclophilin B)